MRPAPPGLVPFRIEVPAHVLDDLAERLARARLPGAPADAGWDYGIEPGYLQRLVDYWRTDYDWRAVEARLNRLPQFMASVGSYRVHLVYEPGSGPAPLPLVLTHGWPGSFVEFEAVAEPLAHPERFGGRIEDAFDVVVPSLPGYGWSSAPPAPISPRDIARLWDELMTSALGRPRYVAQGGDWGGLVTSWLGVDAPSHVAAIHLNIMGLRPYLGEGSAPLSPGRGGVGRAHARAARARDRLPGHPGHEAPDAGLRADRLAGRARRVDRREVPRLERAGPRWPTLHDGADPHRRDDLLGDRQREHRELALHRGPAARRHAPRARRVRRRADRLRGVRRTISSRRRPTAGCSASTTVLRRTDLTVGGHFLAYERPAEFVEDVRAFFRDYRDGRSV